jgi:TRAP-type transport system periplasmic protein
MNNFSRKIILAMQVLALIFFATNLRAADKAVRINLGTLAPRGSSYHKSLQAMTEKWRQVPDGGVRLVIYPDGVQGGEADMVKLMRVGTLQAGLLTTMGLADIEPGIFGLQSAPMMFHDFAEFEYVNDKLRPMLEKRMLEKGFVVLFWADAGWIRFFSKEPLTTPDDLRRAKLFVWAGNPAQVDIMKHAGFNPVPIETSDILPSLQTGLINAVPVPPIFALASQMDTRAPHMLKLNWAPLVGACVVAKDTWDKVPAGAKEALLQAATQAGREIQASSRKESDEAVEAMKKRGLKAKEVTPEMENQWRAEAEKVYPEIRGRIVPADIFDEVQRLVKEYRANGAKK